MERKEINGGEMSRIEDLIYQNASLEKEVALLRGKLQKLQSWLKVNNSGIWEDWKKYRKSEALKNDSKSRTLLS